MIEKISDCFVAKFQAMYIEPRRPVVVTDLTDRWPAALQWSPTLLAERFGERKVEVRRGGKLYLTTLNSYVRYLDTQAARAWGSPAQTSDLIYLHALVIAETLPELLNDFAVPPLFLPNWMEYPALEEVLPNAFRASSVLFVGPAGARSATHRDRYHTHAWLTQIYGEKQFWLLAPEHHHTSYEDSKDADRSLIDNFGHFDPGQCPLFNPDHLQQVRLCPGETLFIPAGWWHGAQCLSTSISLSANFVNHTNFTDFSKDLPLPVKAEQLAALAS